MFEDNFEKYNTGTFPYGEGWELWFNGAGTEQQIIVDSVCVSPTNSLKLHGLHGWAAFAAKQFTSSSQVIGFEVAVRVEQTNGQSCDNARVSFTKKLSSSISCEYAPVVFQDSGTIGTGNVTLQSYEPNTWYNIKMVMNRTSETYSVWVDGELRADNLSVTTTSGETADFPSYGIEAFSVSQCYNETPVYFDDVKIFSGPEVDTKLELVPTEGIAATTLVGSGFAPNSKISVTWDNILIPTVPSPLVSDSYGNFTCIISALNQTNGSYQVKATDELGNKATATFKVTLSPTKSEQNNETSLPASLELLGGGARWAAENGNSALFINWKDNWLAHHLTEGTDWNPWPTESDMDNRRFSVSYALEQAGFNVDFVGDVPETLTNYDLVVIDAFWAVEPQHASVIADYLSDGGGVVVLSGVPCYFTVYCKDMWPYRAEGSKFDGYRFGLSSIRDWFGADYYINVGGYSHLVSDNPFGTSLSVDERLLDVESKSAASVSSMGNNTQVVSLWDSDYVFAFTNEYGQGRLYYQAAYECISESILESNELAVTSSPIDGIAFEINGESQLTPCSVTVHDGTYTVVMPETQDGYVWSHWLDDGDTNRMRVVTVDDDTVLTAVFTPEKNSTVVSVLSPENMTYSTLNVPLEYTVNQDYIWAAYSLDGEKNVMVTGNTTLTGLSEGPHNVTVFVEDGLGNVCSSEPVDFTVALAPVELSILSPENKTYNTAEIPLTLTKNETCNYLGYSLDEQPTVDAENATALYSLADGTHQFTVYANYTGSVMTESVTIWFTVDTTPPNIVDVVQAPVNVNGRLEEGIIVNATVTDELSGVAWVTLNYTGDNEMWTVMEMTNIEANIWSGIIPEFLHGTNVTYNIGAQDNMGNSITIEELSGQLNNYEVLSEYIAWVLVPLLLAATAATIAYRKQIFSPALTQINTTLHKLATLKKD
ncbi:MAG: hypothetical protein CW691_09035 [Candidatus Bathyarchaeum sp.]|nr:MAG: hypothetical protein CW691_09035 [Candidatus Bathyarchaeum sp.]